MAELVTLIRMPALREMLAEPVVRAVMARDGVMERDVTTALAKARVAMAGAEAAARGFGARTLGLSELSRWRP